MSIKKKNPCRRPNTKRNLRKNANQQNGKEIKPHKPTTDEGEGRKGKTHKSGIIKFQSEPANTYTRIHTYIHTNTGEPRVV